MDILETQLMQRTVSLAAVTSMAPSLTSAMLELDSANAGPMCRGGVVMNASVKPSACNREGAVFPATVILSDLNHLTVKRVDSVGASLESQGRNVTAVPMDISTSKKEAA